MLTDKVLMATVNVENSGLSMDSKKGPNRKVVLRIYLTCACAVVFADALVYSLALPILPVQMTRSFGYNETLVGVVLAIMPLATVASYSLTAKLCDEYGKVRSLVVSTYVMGVLVVLFGLSSNFYSMLLLRAAAGVCSGVAWTSGLAIVNIGCPTKALKDAGFSRVMAAESFGALLGPGLGGYLFDLGGYRMPFVVVGIAVFVSGIAMSALTKFGGDSADGLSADETGSAPPAKASLGSLLRNGHTRTALICTLVCGATLTAVDTSLPLYLSSKFDSSATAVGILLTIMSITFTVACPVVAEYIDMIGPTRMMSCGFAIAAICIPGMALAESVVLVGVLSVLFGAAASLQITPTFGLLTDGVQFVTGEEPNVIFYSIYNAWYSLGMLFGPLLANIFIEYLGFHAMMLGFGLCLSIYTIFLSDARTELTNPAIFVVK